MSEWGVALIAAGSALAGSAATGWFTRSAGQRQAAAARHAGDRQADALLETVRRSLEEQRAVRVLDLRRQTYIRFLEAMETSALTRRTATGDTGAPAALRQALAAVLLEGPAATARAANEAAEVLGRSRSSPDDIERARHHFIDSARAALGHPDGPVPS